MRKWLPNLAELIDRLSIHQLKEVFLPEHKDKYYQEMMDICNDIDEIIKEDNITINSDLIHIIIILSQLNTHVWYNESKARKGESQDLSLLKLTHGLNGLRSRSMNRILSLINEGGRKDYKVDCLAAEFKDWKINALEKE